MQGQGQGVPRARTGAAGKGQSPGQHSGCCAAPLQHPEGELRSELRQSLPTNAVTELKLKLSWSDFAKPTALQSAVQRLKTALPWFLRTEFA